MSQKVRPLSKPTTSDYVRGSLYGLAAVSIWASWIVAARVGLKTSLTPWDITAIRFGVAGLILLPYLLKKALPSTAWGGWDWQRLCSAVGTDGVGFLRWSAIRTGSTR